MVPLMLIDFKGSGVNGSGNLKKYIEWQRKTKDIYKLVDKKKFK